MSRRRITLTVVTVGAAAMVACSAPAENLVIPMVYDLDVDPTAGLADVHPDRGEVAPADELRAILEGLLGWHGITMAQAMQAAADGSDDAWIDALVGNTDDITDAVGLVYGPVAAGAFRQQWAQHTQFLVDVAVAEINGDRAAIDEATRHLTAYATDSGSFLDVATDGRLPADVVTALLLDHVEHMVEQLRAHLAGDPERSREVTTGDHEHLLVIAGALASAIADQFPEQFPGTTATERALFRTDAALASGRLAIAGLAGLDESVDEFCGDLELLFELDPEVSELLDEFRAGVASADATTRIDAARRLAPAIDGVSARSR